MNNKKIVFLTGTRADFGKLKSLIDKVEQSSMFECYVFVTGMHTLSKYGSTYDEIQKHGFKNIFVFMNQTHTTDADVILSNTITGFSNFIKEIRPAMIVIHGDRIEALAGAIVGSFNNILVSHVEGGELSGTLDESIRHAITKLSHAHFVANENAKRRLIQLGEPKNNIFIIGSPDIDIMKGDTLPSINEVKTHYEIPFDNYAILIFHPITTEIDTLTYQIRKVVSAVIKSKISYVVIYPNNDNGSDMILREYDRLKNNKNFKVFPSIRFESFLTLLRNSKFIIGNSSAGVREAEIYGIPSINIGSREKNRHNGKNIINVNSHEKDILSAISKVTLKHFKPSNTFGDGKSNERFFKILSDKKIWNISIQKQFIDLKTK